jgi:glycosyltransferase involved in cell wall biosynthesis
MKLSFVIPAYNEETCIGKCLESVARETGGRRRDVEIIVVNNASTDRTRSIALSHDSVKVVDEPEKGLAKARHAGYIAAKGDLIANVDADNMIPPGWVERVFEEFSNNNRLVALSGPLVYYDLSRIANFQVRLFYGIGYLAYLVNHFILKKGGMLQGGNFVVKRSALEEIGGYNKDIEFYGEDTDVARRLQKSGYMKFTFRLKMLSSGRRLAEEGRLVSGLRYGVNYFWVLFSGRPFSKKSTYIRVTGAGR